jgi:ferredoxin-NADP reductase
VPAVWQSVTVVAISDETRRAKTFRLRLSTPVSHRAGQHFVVRLTAPDGYTASRSYSVASPPDGSDEIELTVERLDDGEVSTFLHDVVEVGDELEVRGPIGGFFAWDGTTPALLLGGGSGLVPLMAMLRLARATGHTTPGHTTPGHSTPGHTTPDAGLVHLVVSVRGPDDLYYSTELLGHDDATVLYTRTTPPAWSRPAGRLRADDVTPLLRDDQTLYVCGSAPFTDAVGDLLLELGVAPERARFERFGPSA